MTQRDAILFAAVAALFFCVVRPASAQNSQYGRLHERGAGYEIYQKGGNEYVFVTGSIVPQWTYDADKKEYVPFVVKRHPDGEEIRSGFGGLRVRGEKLALLGVSGKEEVVSEERWVLLRDGKEEPARLLSASTVQGSSEVVHSRLYATAAGDFTLSYIFNEGKPVKQEVRFTALLPGEYSLAQEWVLSADEAEESGQGYSFRRLKLEPGTRHGRLKSRGETLPRELSFRKGGRRLIGFSAVGGEDKYEGYESEPARSRTRFLWGSWKLSPGEKFVLDPTYTTGNASMTGQITTTAQTGASCGTPTSNASAGILYTEIPVSTLSSACRRTFFGWDVSAIPNSPTISSIIFYYRAIYTTNAPTVAAMSMTADCTGTDPATMWNAVGAGTLYNTFTPVDGTRSLTLGGNANADLASRTGGSEQFCVGLKINSETRGASEYSFGLWPAVASYLVITYTASGPSFFAVTHSPSPVRGGYGTETITATAEKGTAGTSLKMYACKAADATSAGCGAGGTWCSVTGSGSNPQCSFTAPVHDGLLTYYAYVYNDLNTAAVNNPLSRTFTVDSTTPTVTVVSVAGDYSAPYVDGVNDSVTSVVYSLSEAGSCRWYDTDSDYNVAQGTACSAGSAVKRTLQDISNEVGFFASMIIPADGRPVVSYYNSGTSDLQVARCATSDCSTTVSISTPDALNQTGYYTSIAVASDGLPIVSYFYGTAADLRVLKCGNAACSAGNNIYDVDTSAIAAETAIAILPSGLPVIAYRQGTSLYLAKCGNSSCSTAGGYTRTPVDTNSPLYIDMAIGADGYPFIVYGTGAVIKTARCLNDVCSSANIRTLDGIADEYVAVEVSSYTGLPVIVYQDDNAIVKLVRCADADCASSFSVKTLAAGRDPTERHIVDVAIGADGLPAVAYYNSDNRNMYLARCADPYCERIAGRVSAGIGSEKLYMKVGVAIGPDNVPAMAFYDDGGRSLAFMKCPSPDCSSSACVIDNASAAGSHTRYVSCADSVGNTQTSANNLDVSWTNNYSPPSVSVSSVSGDTTFSYVSISTVSAAMAVINGEPGMACRWDTSAFDYSVLRGTACFTSGSQANCHFAPAGLGNYTYYVACRGEGGNAHTAAQNLPVSFCNFPVTAPMGSAAGWTWGGNADGQVPYGTAANWNWQAPCTASSFPMGRAAVWKWSSSDTDGDGVSDTADCAPDDNSRWQLLSCYKDADGDGYTTGPSVKVCKGSACDSPSGHRAAQNSVAVGPRNPGTASNITGYGGKSWNSTGNIFTSNDQNATASLENKDVSMDSELLSATNFGFTISTAAVIDGINVSIEGRSQGASTTMENGVYVIKGGSAGYANRASSTPWTTSDVVRNYGGMGDLWGETWTAADINSSGFGFGLNMALNDDNSQIVYVDHMSVTVYIGDPDDDSGGGIGNQIYASAGNYSWTVPTGTTTITVRVWSGGGGGGRAASGCGTGGNGGGGGFAKADLAVTPGENLTIVVGSGGSIYSGAGSGGGGGGYSAIKRGATFLVQAGAGGGGGAGDASVCTGNGGAGAPGGGLTALAGTNGTGTIATNKGYGGQGGTQAAGGAGGTGGVRVDGSAGALNAGGAGSNANTCCGGGGIGGVPGGANGGLSAGGNAGGGGGAGYYGGGGGEGGAGGGTDGAGGGGGGGSCLVTGTNTSTGQGSGTAAANNGDAYYSGSAGQGGTGVSTGDASSGNPGLVVITY